MRTHVAVLLATCLLGLAACGGSASSSTPPVSGVAYQATLDGTQEVPAVTTTAQGTAQIVHDPDNDTIDITITATGIPLGDITGFHIHVGAPGVNGGVIVNLSGLGLTFSDIGGGTLQTSGQGLAFPDGNESDLIAGNCYVNVHTTTNPPGEIRGQIVTP